MEPPVWVCKKLAEVDPNARLGYDGEHWSIVKLYHSRDIEKKFIAEPDYWLDRGPIFAADGTQNRDYDPLNRVACAVSAHSESSITSGECIEQLRLWVQDVRDTIRDDLLKQSKEHEDMLQQTAEQMTDYAEWHTRHSVKIGEQGPSEIVAKKFLPKKPEEEKVNRHQAELRNLEYAWRAQGWVPREERTRGPLEIKTEGNA